MSWFGKKDEVKPLENQETENSNYQHEETVSEKRLWQMKNVFIAFWLLILFIVIAIVAVGLVPGMTDFSNRVILWTVLVIVYAIILFFLLEPKLLREVNRKETHTVEKQVTVDRPVIQNVDREVIKEVIKEVPVVKEIEKPIYYPVARPKLEIPKYDYIASSQTKRYHTNNCRLGKSIKKRYKEFSNDANDFKKKKYAPCKSCITKQVKV